MATGWTWEYIDECVTVPRLQEMLAFWGRVPPAMESLAAIARSLGAWKPAEDPTEIQDGEAFVRDFLAAGGQLTPSVPRHE